MGTSQKNYLLNNLFNYQYGRIQVLLYVFQSLKYITLFKHHHSHTKMLRIVRFFYNFNCLILFSKFWNICVCPITTEYDTS